MAMSSAGIVIDQSKQLKTASFCKNPPAILIKINRLEQKMQQSRQRVTIPSNYRGVQGVRRANGVIRWIAAIKVS